MKINLRLALAVSLALSFFATSSWADFRVVGQEVGDEYGNGQTGTFRRAMTGGSPITQQEQADLAKMLPVSDLSRYYGRIRLNFGTLTLDQLKNRSQGVDAGGSINKKRNSSNQVGFEVAIGYIWGSNFRGDIEYFANKNLNYTASPALLGSDIPARQLNAQVKNNTLLANLYYEFSGVYRFKPYLTAGAGVSVNSVQATVLPSVGGATSTSKRNMQLAYGLGAGMRVGIFSRWYMDVSYRYIHLGSNLTMQNQTFKVIGNSSMTALSLGVIYLF